MEAWHAPGWWPAPARRARVTDRLVTAVLLAWAIPDVPWWRPAGHSASTPAVLGYLALMLAQSLPFLWWRRVPLLAAGLAATVFAVRTGLSHFARELHDVISHQLSAIAVQAGAARMASQQDPAVAVRTVSGIEDIARHGLIELNRIVGAMRRDKDEYLDRRPQPRLSDLPDLGRGRAGGRADGPADRERLAGAAARRGRAGRLPGRPGGPDQRLAIRKVGPRQRGGQLSRRRARPGGGERPASVRGRGAAYAGRGRGLPGLAERAQLLGGRLQAGPRPDGGFAVRAWLPVSQ